ncbi:MAG: TIGR00341 family protein [Bacteroidaceae bacterium]|nr:TIGR00341 family protein [Bacteroidaceae bacterium]
MNVAKILYNELKERLDPTPDKENESTVIDNVRRAVEFRGVTLWILIFAVLIASIGLNIDSVHMIFGAMLISPLMGPIIGTGLAVGINDMELMKRSLRNLFTASLFAVFAATIYFWISPLNEAQSELLSRTSPTMYDVIVAFIGGAAGFLALSSTGNRIQVIVGVAISTALLPPLCTVGFCIATGRWLLALGALYLFFINSVFIAISTYLGARILKFSPKAFADKQHEHKVKRMLIIISAVTLLPSVVLTYNIVRKTIYTQNAENFITQELHFNGAHIIEKQVNYTHRTIQAVYIGNHIPQAVINNVRSRLPQYHLQGTHLDILQDGERRDSIMLSSLRANIARDIYRRNDSTARLIQQISALRDSLDAVNRFGELDRAILEEAHTLFPHINSVTLGYQWSSTIDSTKSISGTFARVTTNESIDKESLRRLTHWLRQRTNQPQIQIQIEEKHSNEAAKK